MPHTNLAAPTPLRNKLLSSLAPNVSSSLHRSSSGTGFSSLIKEVPYLTSRTPDPRSNPAVIDKEQELLKERLQHYNLDYPQDHQEYLEAALDKESKWFSRKTKRKLDLIKLLPYSTETHTDHAKYLSHVIVHLYIAIKSMDLEGLVSISTKDLAAVRDNVDLALDTDFFNADLKFDVETGDDDDEEGDEEDDEVRSSGIIGKVMPRSATVVSVNHWTNELKSCLKMKMDLPLTLRASLARVYYYLALSTGQAIQDELFITMFIKLTSKYKDLLTEKETLVLDHKPMLNYMSQFFPDPNPSYDIYCPSTSDRDRSTMALYLKLASHARSFYDTSALREVYDWSLGRFSPLTGALATSVMVNCIPFVFAKDESILDFLSSFFHLFTNNKLNKVMDLHLLEFLGKISTKAYEQVLKGDLDISIYKDFGVFTEDQFNFILNKLQLNLRFEQKINSFHGVSSILINSITADNFDKLIEKITTLLSSLETFAHPSNNGPWTHLIGRFIQRCIFRYHKRFSKEKSEDFVDERLALTAKMNTVILLTFKDMVMLGSQSKKESSSNHFVSSIGYLCDLPSDSKHVLINQILLDLYDSLTDQYINSTHRLVVSLKQFMEIARFMIDDQLYRVHISNILSLVLNKIGTNDLTLTNSVFNVLVTVVSLIQFHDFSNESDFISFESNTVPFIQEHLYFIKENPGSQFQPDPEVLKLAFVASTKIFKDLVKTLIDKLILLLDADLNEKLLFKFSQTLLILVESLSQDVFDYMVKVVKEKLISNDLNNQGENEPLMANIVASVIKRDPTLSIEFFFMLDKMIRFEIEQGAGSTRNKTSKILGGDRKLVLYLTIISEILSVSLGESLNFKKDYLNLISFLYDNITNPSLNAPATYVIHKTLKNLTNVKLKENRVFQQEPDPTDFDSRWGLNQFSDSKFDENNLQFDWYIPTIKEISFAIEIFETIVVKTLTKIDMLIVNGSFKDLGDVDELNKSLLYLSHSLSGASILFDPDFNSEEVEEDFNKTTLQKKLMILKSLRESKSENIELNIDIEEITKKDSNINLPSVASPSKQLDDVNDGAVQLNAHHPEPGTDEKMDVDDEKSLSSRALSPTGPHESDLTSVMNPAIAFREAKLYNCNYFFGKSQTEKRAYSNYGHIHSLRSLIGQTLHRLAMALMESNEENVNLIQVLLLTIRTFFCDVGKESSFDIDDQLFIDYTFLKKVQSLANHSKPFTRTALGARLEKFHRQRVILHSTNRFQSKLDKLLLKDVVCFSTSPFAGVYQPSQIVLIETMKKLIGSYGVIISDLLKRLEDFVAANDIKRLESGLRIFRLKKISRKLIHDYANLKKIVEILGICLNIKDHDINEIAQKCFNDLCLSVQVPSAVALYEESQIDDALRPRDQHIDLEISTVKTAKDLKRGKYISKLLRLQDFLLSEEEKVDHWKLSLFYLRFTINLQEYYEFPTKARVLQVLIERSKTHHPALVRLCIKAFARLVNKIMSFAAYEHDLEKSFTIGYQRDEILQLDSSVANFAESFNLEAQNLKNPNYFIDGKLFNGFLFWGRNVLVLKAGGIDLKLNADDIQTLNSIGSLLTKDLLKQIFEVLAQENEATGNFQENEVSLIVATIKLIQVQSSFIQYRELLELISEFYNKDEKAAVIIATEITCALFEATSFTSLENLQQRDQFVTSFFEKALFSDLTPESTAIWNVMFWLLPTKVDFRRNPVLFKQIEAFKGIVDIDSNSAFGQASRLGFTRSYLSGINFKNQDYTSFMDNLPLAHPYQLVRDQLGGLLASLQYSFFRLGLSNSTAFLELQQNNDCGTFAFIFPEPYSKILINAFQTIKEESLKIRDISAQEALKSKFFYLSSTILVWLDDSLNSPYSAALLTLVKDYISPFLIELQNNRELCKLGGLHPTEIYTRIAGIFLRKEQIPDILSITTVRHSRTHQILMQLGFIELFFSRNLLLLSSEQQYSIVQRIDELLFHSSVEVRSRASSVLSGIIHNSQDLRLTSQFIQKYNKILSKNRKSKGLSNEKVIELHGSTLGVGALISAFPYTSPPPEWMPHQIVILARVSSMNGVIGKAAKEILSNFKKLRADTWHIDRSSFTDEQLEDLEGVLWTSYFA